MTIREQIELNRDAEDEAMKEWPQIHFLTEAQQRPFSSQLVRVMRLIEAAKYLRSMRGSPLERAGIGSVIHDLEILEANGDI